MLKGGGLNPYNSPHRTFALQPSYRISGFGGLGSGFLLGFVLLPHPERL